MDVSLRVAELRRGSTTSESAPEKGFTSDAVAGAIDVLRGVLYVSVPLVGLFLPGFALEWLFIAGLLVGLGHPQQHPDGAHGDLGADVGHEVEAAGADERVEGARREGPHLVLQGQHLLGGEDPGQQAPVQIVVGRLELSGPGRLRAG